MKVKDLIIKLQGCDPEAEVVFARFDDMIVTVHEAITTYYHPTTQCVFDLYVGPGKPIPEGWQSAICLWSVT